MFNTAIDKIKVTQNHEWLYLVRVLVIAGIVAFIVYKLWLSWAFTEDTSVKAESATVGFNEKDISFIKVDETIIIDKESKDVLSCAGDVPNTCVQTGYNCSNIATFDLWLRPKENVKRCQSTTAYRENYLSTHKATSIPICSNGQRLWFTPSTKMYFCK